MKYTVRVNTEYLSPYFTSGEVVKKNKDRDEVMDLIKDRSVPDTRTTIRIFKDARNNRPIIKINQEDLDLAVRAFSLVDKKENKAITTADLNFGLDPFWNNPDLFWEIPNLGETIDVQNFTLTPKESFWFSVAEVDPRFFINDGKHERPENMSSVLFTLTPMYMDEDKESLKVGKDSSMADVLNISRIVIKMDRERKMYLLDAVNVPYEDKANDEVLEKLIFDCLENPGSYRVVGQTFDQFLIEVSKYNEQEFDVHGLVKMAYKKDLIEMKNNYYYFGDSALGYSINETVKMLLTPKMAGVLKKIRSALKDAE